MAESTDQQLKALLDRFPQIELAILFGSLSVGGPSPASDLDLAVGARRELSSSLRKELTEALAESFGRPVDLVDLATVGEPLLGVILRTGRRVLCRDSSLYAELIKRHVFNVADFEPYRRRILEKRRKAWIER